MNKQQEKNEKKNLVLLKFIQLLVQSLYSKRFGEITDSLHYCYVITKENDFRKIIRKNKMFHAILTLPLLCASIFVFYAFFLDENSVVFKEIAHNFKILSSVFKNSRVNLKSLDSIKFSKQFLETLARGCFYLVITRVLGLIFLKIGEKLNPLITDSEELKLELTDSGFSLKEDKYFLVTRKGILVQSSKSDFMNLFKDDSFWKRRNRVPQEPLELETNRTIAFYGNGFKLTKVEFKL